MSLSPAGAEVYTKLPRGVAFVLGLARQVSVTGCA